MKTCFQTYSSLLSILVITLGAIATSSCDKLSYNASNPGVHVTLDGKELSSESPNYISGLPGDNIFIKVIIDGYNDRQVKVNDDRSGPIGSRYTIDKSTGEGTYQITLIGEGYNRASSVLNLFFDGYKVQYSFDIYINGLVISAPELVDCTPGKGDETVIPFTIRSDLDSPIIIAETDGSGVFEIVSVDYTATKAEDRFYTGSITVRNISDNYTEDERTAKVTIREKDRDYYSITAQINLVQNNFPPERKEGFVYYPDWHFKKAMNRIADKDGDREVSFEEALAVTKVDVSNQDIRSLEGLEQCRNIEWLDVSDNKKIESLIFDDVRSFSKLKYIRAIFGDGKERKYNYGGCYAGPSGVFIDDRNPEGKYTHIYQNDYPKYYESEDFSMAGVINYQTATKGQSPIEIFISTDAIDLDYKSGAIDDYVSTLIEFFFNYEPMKSLRDYFTIYVGHYIDLNTTGMRSGKNSTAENRNLWGEKNKVAYDFIFDHNKKYVETCPQEDYDYERVYAHGFNVYVSSCAMQISWQSKVAHTVGREITMISDDCSRMLKFSNGNIGHTFTHEMGHAFGDFSDQYTGINYTRLGENPRNVWLSDNPEEVPWKFFFGIAQYEGRVGIYKHQNDMWYPSSCESQGNFMVCGPENGDKRYPHYYFDSVCRFWIFHNVLYESYTCRDWDEIWKMFLEYDKINNEIPY